MGISTSQGGRDPDAIHDNTASEISAITEKTTPVAADMILIEDSAAANVKKMAQLGNLALTDIGARVYNDANISVPDTTATALTFNSERWDTDGIHDTVTNNSRLTCKTAGKYAISATARYATAAGGVLRLLYIRLNGSDVIAATSTAPNGSTQDRLCMDTIYDLDVNDYVEVVAYQSSGGAVNIEASANSSPEFMMQLLAKA